MKVSIGFLEARLRAPVVSAHGELGERGLLVLELEGADGAVGHGEAAPLISYDGVTIGEVRDALEDCRALLGASDGSERAELLAACAVRAVLPQALAAIDLALWDLAGRRAQQPVWRLLGARSAPALAVNATIAAPDRAGAAAETGAARAAGFSCVKLKVGIGDDAGRVASVRAAAGSEIAIRLDANGAWSVREAIAALRALGPAGIELCEQPVAGLDDLATVAECSDVSISLDEGAALPGAIERRVCAAVCLKVSRCGGISGLIDAAATARAAGYEVYLASTFDGPLGIAAALHAAAAIQPDRVCGLATLAMFSGRPDALPVRGGELAAPGGAGLGDGLWEWYGLG